VAATSPPPSTYSYTYYGEEVVGRAEAVISTSGLRGLWNPQGLVVWPGGADGGKKDSLLIGDTDNHRLVMLSPPSEKGGEWELSLFAGSGVAGFDDGDGLAASFRFPRGLALCALDGELELFVADTGNHAVRVARHSSAAAGEAAEEGSAARRLQADDVSVATLAGDGAPGDDDTRTKREKPKASILITTTLMARFSLPTAVACDAGHGGVLVADAGNHRIRQVRSDGVTVTIAGASARGHVDGRGDSARFDAPVAIALDPSNRDMYLVGEGTNSDIRVVSSDTSALTSAP
jgi:hypothetical protein